MKNVKSAGFTLIELVVVIVILGILAASAAPVFMDLQKDARIAKLNGLLATIKSAEHLTYGKSVIAGLEKFAAYNDGATISVHYLCLDGSASDSCNVSNGMAVSFGYPAVLNNPVSLEEAGLLKALDLDVKKYSASDRKSHDWQYKVKVVNSNIYMMLGLSDTELPETYATNDDGSVKENAIGCYVVYANPYKDSDGSIRKMTAIVTEGC